MQMNREQMTSDESMQIMNVIELMKNLARHVLSLFNRHHCHYFTFISAHAVIYICTFLLFSVIQCG